MSNFTVGRIINYHSEVQRGQASKMDIREAKRTDIKQIVSVFHNTIHIVNSRDYTTEEVNAWSPDLPDANEWAEKRLPTRITFVADDEGTIIGFGELKTTGHIDCLYCHHNYQRCGVGAAIFRRIENKALDLGLRRLFVEASITARQFFQSQGFTIVCQQTVIRRGVKLTNFVMEKHIGANHKNATSNKKDHLTKRRSGDLPPSLYMRGNQQ